MIDLQAIKKRRADFDEASHAGWHGEIHFDSCLENCEMCNAQTEVSDEFWNHVEDDEAALIEQVERLRSE